EWKAYCLLTQTGNAHWVQYKLDQRIDHLLVDEFQDTNPTQWQLLLPLLQEMAAGESERARSVFLVGDEKQSIYSFRRAKPELQAIASSWLTDNLGARSFPLNKSWRSSPAIIEFVNSLFTQEEMHALFPDFPLHETHKTELPGEVVVLPALETGSDDAIPAPATDSGVATVLRNPLQQPREEAQNLHDLEGRQIAQQIRQLVDNKTAVQVDGFDRAMQYDDIFILLRKRTHVASYEKALRDAGIPYMGANRGSLLECIEIDDMLALLDTLLTPFNNLALAQVLKSPLFSADDIDLMQLAAHKSIPLWIDRLAEIAAERDEQHPLHRAHHYLCSWSALADRIPVHDLLDRIYHESQLVERYVATSPPSLKPRVRANLIRFLEMALDLDSGRYPSLMHFLLHIRELQQQERDAPDEAPMQTDDARVRIMTIHASKGLEAPVVFLADTINNDPNRDTLSALVEWPAQQERPTHIQLIPTKDSRDQISDTCLDNQKRTESQEQLHLLYVAVTRAKQCLYISACRPEIKPSTDWYTPIENAV
ncbi:MAG TPA: 3'-5' exonuclease, partial [Gammaproteobacteria bacterium]|nr:3'-5' exonuclease [Gammaproteobacteria bacterium]